MNIVKKAYNFFLLRKYNEYTIAEYFRKQGAQVGNDCYFGIKYLSSEPYLIKIGNHVQIANGVKFLTHNPGWCYRHVIPDLQVFGKIIVEDNSYVGENAILLPNVTICKDSIVAAGAVVTKDVQSNSIVGGNPARRIGSTDEYFLKAMNSWKEQKPNGYLSELQDGQEYTAMQISSIRNRKENRELLKNHLINLFWENSK